MSEVLAVSPELLFEIAAGSVGGLCSKALDYPFDTAKVLLQTQQVSSRSSADVVVPPRYSGTLDCLRQSVKEKGFISLYDGIGSRLLGSMAENAVCFLAYGTIKKQLMVLKEQQQQEESMSNDTPRQVKLSLLDLSIAGAGSGAVVSFLMTPTELIKCRMQVSSQLPTPLYRGSLDCMFQTIKQEGIIRGLYKGHLSTMYREVPGNFCWYLTYELVCDALAPALQCPRDRLPMEAHMAGGAAAGVMYWVAIFPVDTVKSVLQTSSTHKSDALAVPSSFQQTWKTLYQEQGIRGLYRGFGVTAMRAAPANAVLFAGYEQTVKFLKKNI